MGAREDLERYRRYLESLDQEAQGLSREAEAYFELLSPGEAIDVLCTRDALAQQHLDDHQREELERLDQLLVQHAPLIVGNVPPKPDIPRARWWWHLDEGPQVRDEALAASRLH